MLGSQNIGSINRDALGFVNRGCVAVIKIFVKIRVKRNRAATVEPYRNILGTDALDGTQGPAFNLH